jgi:hypothetical protein
LTLPAVLATLLAVEVVVRLTWDKRRGTPGLFVTDPALVQRFAPNYSGWFAGVPVRINNLGLRAEQDYSLHKGASTFRVLVLGDSVTFGHGSVYEHSYPYLLEQRLERWRPDVDWQVWNAGVPGYNSAQELAYLRKIGPVFRPDLVVVGFYPNDIIANEIVAEPTRRQRASASAKNWLRQTFYSYELYRRLYLELSWRVLGWGSAYTLLENLGHEAALLADMGQIQNLPQQQLTEITPVSAEAVASVNCHSDGRAVGEVRRFDGDASAVQWRAAIDGFQELQRRSEYRVMFFVNITPDECPPDDLFFDGGSRAWNDFFLRELARDAPAVSTYDAFLRYRLSQVPDARGHALGNANRVKADVLFDFLAPRVVPLLSLPANQSVK